MQGNKFKWEIRKEYDPSKIDKLLYLGWEPYAVLFETIETEMEIDTSPYKVPKMMDMQNVEMHFFKRKYYFHTESY